MSSENIQGRWWEGYLVRYLVGTPIGAACVLAILHKLLEGSAQSAYYHAVLLGPVEHGGVSLNPSAAIVIGVLGLAYCYVASAPITVIHVSRMFRRTWFNSLPRYSWFLLFIILVFLSLRSIIEAKVQAPVDEVRITAAEILLVLALPAVWMIFAQFLCVMRLHVDEPAGSPRAFGRAYRRLALLLSSFRVAEFPPGESDVFVRYYSKLAENRERASGLRESYTHMREHSNSVFIAVLEISLACLLYWVLNLISKDLFTRAAVTAAIVMAWLLPNVFLWAQANRLERSLVS